MSEISARALHEALAAELRAAQGVAHVNVRAWADRASITHDTIYRILNGKRPVTVVELVTLCHALDDDPLELIQRAADRAGLSLNNQADEVVRSDRAQLALEAANLYGDLDGAYRKARQTLGESGQLLPLREWRAFIDGAGSQALVTSLAAFLEVPAEYLLGQMSDDDERTKKLEARLRLSKSMRSLGVTRMAARSLDELEPEEIETVEATIRALIEREEGPRL